MTTPTQNNEESEVTTASPETNIKIRPLVIEFDSNYVYIQYQGEKYMQFDINSFEENTGLTVQNIRFPVPAYVIALCDQAKSASLDNVIVMGSNTTLSCGNVIENLFESIRTQIDNQILIIDFDGIEEISSNFAQSYTQYLLNTKNKVISVNQNWFVHMMLSGFIIHNINIQALPENELFDNTKQGMQDDELSNTE